MIMRRVLFVFSSTLWTSITSLPFRFAYLFYTFCTVINKEQPKNDANVTGLVMTNGSVNATLGDNDESELRIFGVCDVL